MLHHFARLFSCLALIVLFWLIGATPAPARDPKKRIRRQTEKESTEGKDEEEPKEWKDEEPQDPGAVEAEIEQTKTTFDATTGAVEADCEMTPGPPTPEDSVVSSV